MILEQSEPNPFFISYLKMNVCVCLIKSSLLIHVDLVIISIIGGIVGCSDNICHLNLMLDSTTTHNDPYKMDVHVYNLIYYHHDDSIQLKVCIEYYNMVGNIDRSINQNRISHVKV